MDLPELIQAFDSHGLSLRPQACNYLKSKYLSNPNLSDDTKTKNIQKIINRLTNLDGADSDIRIDDTGVVDVPNIEQALRELEGRHQVKENNPFVVVDCFKDVKKFYYNPEKQDMLLDQRYSPENMAKDPDSYLIRTDMFLARYHAIKARLKRLKHDREIISIESVKNLTPTSKSDKVCILTGLLIKIDQTHFELEDPTGKILLDFAATDFIKGCYFIENCIYVVKGFLETSANAHASGEEVFCVTNIALPPIEETAVLRKTIGAKNLFGTSNKKCASSNHSLKKIERDNQDIFFVFMNEVWLDSPRVLKNFEQMLRGFVTSDMIPAAIIMTGNFSNTKFVNDLAAVESYTNMFVSFAKKLHENFPEVVENTRFIFVPGHKDPGSMGTFMPRPGLYQSITDKVKKYLKAGKNEKTRTYFTSNPCRIQYCSQEIIVCKLDVSRLLETFTIENSMDQSQRRNRTQKEKVNDLTMTVNSQSHLCPLPLDVQPVLDHKDHILAMYNLPDLIVYGQGDLNVRQFYKNGIASPGSFGERGLFQVYFPATREMQESEVSSAKS